LACCCKQTLLDGIRQAAELDECRGDVRGGQDGEISCALRTVEQHDLAPELVHDLARERD